ncbi:hypothetical protein [Lentzea sp. NPDC060358]|uniref:hypothetical protein n=1 Tax=Lentzea sp. NPDC060358 TaxID=3347103 RepID=UPI003665A82A
MGESFEVVVEALTAHSTGVLRLSDELRSAAALAAGQRITAGAYGQTGREFAALLGALASAGEETLRLAVDCLEAEAAKVRASAAEFDRQETAVAEALRVAGGGFR